MSGSKAMTINGVKFLQGTETDVTGKGAFVLEFWATWCPPCLKSIPHLNELAEQYPKVTFIGVTDENIDLDTVKRMGIKYSCAIGNSNTSAIKSQFQVRGIPHAFVIKDGVVLFSGHPMDPGMTDALSKVNSQLKDEERKEQAQAIEKYASLSKEELGKLSVTQIKGALQMSLESVESKVKELSSRVSALESQPSTVSVSPITKADLLALADAIVVSTAKDAATIKQLTTENAKLKYRVNHLIREMEALEKALAQK